MVICFCSLFYNKIFVGVLWIIDVIEVLVLNDVRVKKYFFLSNIISICNNVI